MEQILSHLSNMLSYIIEKPTDSIIKRREYVFEEFRKFRQMCDECAVWDLWKRLDNKGVISGYTFAKATQIRYKMNELLDDMSDVFSPYEMNHLKWILDIFQDASCSRPTKSKHIWYYYPPEKEYKYEECAIMMTQILADFDSLLHSEIHSWRKHSTIQCTCRQGDSWRPEE